MNHQVAAAKQALTERDQSDALRVVQAAVTLAAIPGMISGSARELAACRLRELASAHPRGAEVFAAVVQHLESF